MTALSFDEFTAEELNAAIALSGMSRKSIAGKLNCHPSYIPMMINGRGLPSNRIKCKFVELLSEYLVRIRRSRK